MAQTLGPLPHYFAMAGNACRLTVALPSTFSSANDVVLDVGCEAVRVGLLGACTASLINCPVGLKGRIDVKKSSAKFSRKRAQLIVKLPLSELAEDACSGEIVDAATPVSKCAPEQTVERSPLVCTTPSGGTGDKKLAENVTVRQELASTSGQQLHERKVQGSGWNANSWHWEERPMIKWSQAWFNQKFASVSWPLLYGRVNFSFSEIDDVLKGDISLCVRKGRPVVLYELTAMCRWKVLPLAGTEDFQCRGSISIRDFTSEEGLDSGPEAAEIEVAVNIDTSKGRYASKAVKDGGVLRNMRSVLKQFLDELIGQAASPKV